MDNGPRHDKNFGLYGGTVKQKVLARLSVAIISVVSYIEGIDISAWNYLMNFLLLPIFVKFLMVRGGYNKTRDSRFSEYKQALLAKKVPFGIYWYVYAGYDMNSQLLAFQKVLDEGGWVLPPCADFEYTILDSAKTTAWIKLFMEKLQALYPTRKLMIYTSPGWWNSHVLRNTWAKLYWLWVAHWTTLASPILPYDWPADKAIMWQYSADGNGLGTDYGSFGDADMDLDRFIGPVELWNELTGAEVLPDPILPIPAWANYSVTSKTLLIRTGPSTKFGTTGGVRIKGEIVYPKEIEIWVKDDRGWSAVRHLGEVHMVPIP